jgi:ABC-2 type transport system permease protein
MTATSFAVREASAMLRRDVRHAVRYPMMTIGGLMVPVVMLLLFDGVFGHALRAGIAASRGRYIDYLTPGIILMTVGAGSAGTAINICMDMGEGIIARFRTMPISRASVLTGQVAGGTVRTLISGVLVVSVALGLGFRPTGDPGAWLAATAVFGMLTVALSWLAVAFGLLAKTPAGANSLSLMPEFLPFVSSAFVPTATMPAGVRWFAQNQPFTPIIETLRGLLTGGPIGSHAAVAVVWCAVITFVGYTWSVRLYERGPRP